MNIKIQNALNPIGMLEKHNLSKFLSDNLEQEHYTPENITRSIDYALGETSINGGFVLSGFLKGELIGALVINKTGMGGYLSENLLVLMAIDEKYRKQGYGRQLFEKATDLTDGEIFMHIPKDHSAMGFFRKIGFDCQRVEMKYCHKK